MTLNKLKNCNKIIEYLNDNFKVWSLVNNNKSACITIKGIKKRGKKPYYFVINQMGEVLKNGNNHIDTIPLSTYSEDQIIAIEFKEYLEN